MRGVRTHGAASQTAGLYGAKAEAGLPGGVDSFKLRLQSAVSTPGGIAGLTQAQGVAKAKALRDGVAAETSVNAAKSGVLAKKNSAANDAAEKIKGKQSSKPGSEAGSGMDVKTVDGAGAGLGMVGVPLDGVPNTVQPVQVKKDAADGAAAGINSASTSTLQPVLLPVDVAAGPVEFAGLKQAETSVLEVKTKRGGESALVSLGERPTAGAVGADGLPGGVGLDGIAVGGLAGQGMQGGHAGSSGHGGQAPQSHAAAGAVPQVVASSPSQLDVGVYDDTHGWLRIRAELGAGGGVNATLTSADAAHESLKTALPEMTHYLGTESVHVNSIELNKFGDTQGGQQPGSHGEGHQQGSMGGNHAGGGDGQQTGAQAMVMPDDAAGRSRDSEPELPDALELGTVAGTSAVAGSMIETAGDAVSAVVAGTKVSIGDGQMPDVGSQVIPWQVGYGGTGGWVNVSA